MSCAPTGITTGQYHSSVNPPWLRTYSPQEELSPRWLLELDQIPQHMIVLAADGRCLYANQVALDFHGCALEEFLEENTLPKTVHPDDLATYVSTFRHANSRAVPYEVEARLLSRSGQYRWFQVMFRPLQ